MKPEQRLLLALILTFGILLVWTKLAPPPAEPRGKYMQDTVINTLTNKTEPEDSILDFATGPFIFGIGANQGGLHSLKANGASLLQGTYPGLLQIELLKPESRPLVFQTELQGQVVASRSSIGPGVELSRQISADPRDKSLFRCQIVTSNNSGSAQKFQVQVSVYRPLYLTSLHLNGSRDKQFQQGFFSGIEGTRRIQLKQGHDLNYSGRVAWISSQGKSHTLIVQPASATEMFHVEHSKDGSPVGWIRLPETQLSSGEKAEWRFLVYAGPLDLKVLRTVGLEEAVSFGTFSGIAKLLFGILTWCESRFHNYGWSIVAMGFSIWLLFFPVTWSGIRMTKVMGQLQPHIERLKKEHTKNPQKMNQEMLQLYRKYRVNPLSGCLPLFFQMPIFIALFQVLNRSPELRGAGFLWIRDLSAPDALVRFSSPVPLLGESLNILPLLMMAGMFVQQRMAQGSRVAVTEEQAMQQKMFKWFPLFFGFLFYGLPSGLVLYWVTNTALTLGQYFLYSRVHHQE